MMHRTSRAALARTAVIAWATMIVALSVAACTDVGSPTTRDRGTAWGGDGGESGGGGDVNAALVGRWSRTVIFTTDDGDLHSSETTWSFQNGFAAQRWVIAASVAAGIADTVITDARWEASAIAVTITFEPPDSGVVTFDYSVRADTLTLGSVDFVRVD